VELGVNYFNFSEKYSIVDCKPDSKSIVGSHPSFSLAREIFGSLVFGSSLGRAL
jgi:hypothetical protein